MRRNLSVEDLDGLLEEARPAVLLTHRPNGTPLLSPVWFRWRDGAFETTMADSDGKLRRLRHSPEVGFLVFETSPPFRGIEARGSVELSEEDVGKARLAIAERYLGPEGARAYVETVAEKAVLVRLEPQSIRAWDFSDVWPSPSV
jgi:PPOX class probable F420-dependent enzyme